MEELATKDTIIACQQSKFCRGWPLGCVLHPLVCLLQIQWPYLYYLGRHLNLQQQIQKKHMKSLLRTWNNVNMIKKELKIILFTSKRSNQLLSYKSWIMRTEELIESSTLQRRLEKIIVAHKLKIVHLIQ